MHFQQFTGCLAAAFGGKRLSDYEQGAKEEHVVLLFSSVSLHRKKM